MRKNVLTAGSRRKPVEACAAVGNIEMAIEIAFDGEDLNYEVKARFNASSMISRISKT